MAKLEKSSVKSQKRSVKKDQVQRVEEDKNQSMQLEEVSVGLKMQPKLSFQSEIIHVNTAEEDRARKEQEQEAN